MATTVLLKHRRPPAVWPRWPFELLLWTLFLGPIISPLFRATGLPLLADAGLLARELLSTYVCPTPERSIALFGLPMGVCMRCWGATIGLLAARWTVARYAGAACAHSGSPLQWFRALPWVARLLLAALPFLLWPLEIVGHYSSWWYAPLWLLLLNGAQAGFAAGLLFCSLWPGLWPARGNPERP